MECSRRDTRVGLSDECVVHVDALVLKQDHGKQARSMSMFVVSFAPNACKKVYPLARCYEKAEQDFAF